MIRIVMALISGVAALYFVFWIGSALTLSLHLPFWMSRIISLLVGAAVAWYVWTHAVSFQASPVSSVLMGAFVVGGIGFSAGFFGPLLFAPSGAANPGPLLGLFITGPAGFLLGAVGGFVHWHARGRRRP